MEQRPQLLTAVCGFGERDLLLLASAGRLSMSRGRRYDILPAKQIVAPPALYIVEDSIPGQATRNELLVRFADPHAPMLGVGDEDEPRVLQAFRYAHYRRPILASRLLKALDALFEIQPGEPLATAPAAAPSSTAPGPRPATNPGEPALGTLRGRHVLLVTGNQAIRHMLVARLASLGISASCAQDGETAVRLAMGARYDLALLEPDRTQCADCFALVRQIKQAAKEPLSVLLLTEEITPHDRMRGILNGVDDYLTKPVSVRRLQEALLNHCASGKMV